MANSYTNVGQVQQVNGENSTTWGDFTDTNWDINYLLIAGVSNQAITVADVTPASVNGVADAGKSLIFVTSGALTGNRALIVPTTTRRYLVKNNCTGAYTMTVKTVAGTGVVVPQGGCLDLYSDGTNIVQGVNLLGMGGISTSSANLYTAQQNFSTATLTDGASIAWDLSASQVAKVTLGGNRALANPTNMIDGGTYILRVIQDGTGSRTLAYGANYDFGAAGTPVLTTTAAKMDVITCVSNGTKMYCSISKGFTA